MTTNTPSEQPAIPAAQKHDLLARLVRDQIEREGDQSGFVIRAGLLRDILAARPVEQPAQASEVERSAIVAEVVELAQRDIARTQTDFLGRMGQALCTYEGIFDKYPDGDLPDDARQDAEEEISALAGLALAQFAMLRRPDAPAAALNPSQERAEAGE